MKDDLRVAVYGENNGCVTFYKDTLDKFNFSPYIKLWGKGTRLYFLRSVTTAGQKIGDAGRVQIAKPEIVEVLKSFKGTHRLLFDAVTKYYYVDREKVEAKSEENAGEEKPKPKKEKKPGENVEGILMGCLFESIDGDDLAGAKAILNAMRKIENAKKGA